MKGAVMDDNVKIALAATVASEMYRSYLSRRRAKRMVTDLCEENAALREVLETYRLSTDYLLDIINDNGLGTEFDNIVLNSLLK
jgi:hypothetical protein